MMPRVLFFTYTEVAQCKIGYNLITPWLSQIWNTDGFIHYSANLTTTLSYLDIVVGYNSTTDTFYVYLVFKTNTYKSFEFEVGGNGYGGSLVLQEPTNVAVTPVSLYTLPNSGSNSIINEVMVKTSNRNFYYGARAVVVRGRAVLLYCLLIHTTNWLAARLVLVERILKGYYCSSTSSNGILKLNSYSSSNPSKSVCN